MIGNQPNTRIYSTTNNGFKLENDEQFEEVLNLYTTTKLSYTQGSYMQELYAYSMQSMDRYFDKSWYNFFCPVQYLNKGGVIHNQVVYTEIY